MMRARRYRDISKARVISIGIAALITPIVITAISGLLYIAKELLKNKIIGSYEEYALRKGKLNEQTLVEKLKKATIKECDSELKEYYSAGLPDDEDVIFLERLKDDAMKWRTVSDLEKSPFSSYADVKRVINSYRKAQAKLMESARKAEQSSALSRHDSKSKILRYRDIIRRSNPNPLDKRGNADIKYANHILGNYKKIISKQKETKYQNKLSTKKELLNKSRNISGSKGSSLPLILGGAAIVIVAGLIIKKIRNAIKQNAALKKNAEQNNTDQRYIDFVEHQMRTGQYNEPAIVTSIKAQIIPLLERELSTKYNSGELSYQDYTTAKEQIENIKKATTLEAIYAEIKTPEIKREIVAYRTARMKIERELAMMQQYASNLQMSAYHDAGVKGMKRGEHRMARNEEYVKSLRGGGGNPSPAPANNQQSGGMSTAKKIGIGLGVAAGTAALVGGALGARKLLHKRSMAKKLGALKVKAAAQQAAHNAEIAGKLGELKKQAKYNKSLRGRLHNLGSRLKEGGKAQMAKLRRKFAEQKLKSQIRGAAMKQGVKKKASAVKNAFSLS